MYSQIDSNRRKTWFLIAVFIGMLSAAGWIYGYETDTGYFGLIFALVLSLGMTAVSWFAGDKIALSTSGAVELKERSTFPMLWNAIENLSITAGLPMPRVYIIQDDSPNAFATGRDPQHASVAVTTGLLMRLSKTELEGVLAHEMSHVKNLDTRLMMIVIVLVGAMSLLGGRLLRFRFIGRGRKNEAGALFAIIGLIFLVLSPIIGELIKLAISRKREYLADASGALLTRYPEGLASALEKISAAHLPMQHTSPATNHLWISEPAGERIGSRFAALFSTHPPIADRIAKLREMIK